jgi:hypothetical protein
MVAVDGQTKQPSAQRLTPVSDAFRRQQARAARIAREEEKKRRVKQYHIPEQRPQLTKAERMAMRAAYLAQRKEQAKLRKAAYMAKLNQLTLSPRPQVEKGEFS